MNAIVQMLAFSADMPSLEGLNLEELRENLRDLYAKTTSGNIPGVRRVAKLQLA